MFVKPKKPKVMLNSKAKKLVRKQIRNHFGHCNFAKIRKYLKENSVNEYGCFFYEENVGGGVKVAYTSNPNHYAKYFISLRGVGFVSTLAFTRKDITKDGKVRGCLSHHAF